MAEFARLRWRGDFWRGTRRFWSGVLSRSVRAADRYMRSDFAEQWRCADAAMLLTALELCGLVRIAMARFRGRWRCSQWCSRQGAFQCACPVIATYSVALFLRGLRLRKNRCSQCGARGRTALVWIGEFLSFAGGFEQRW